MTTTLGLYHPRQVSGYSSNACEKVLDHLKVKLPKKLRLIVNLGSHLRNGGDFADGGRTLLQNVARRLGRRHRRMSTEPVKCDSASLGGTVYEMGHPAAADAHDIGVCPQPTCPTAEDPTLQPTTCIPDDSNTFMNALNLKPVYVDKVYQAFEEFRPGYGESPSAGQLNAGWRDYTQSLDDTSLFLGASQEDPYKGALWTGCDQDRVGDYDGLAQLWNDYLTEKGITLGWEIACEFIDDDWEVCFLFFCISFPNPFKIACVAARLIFQLAELGLETIVDQVNYQNGLVDGAEIQAGE